MVSKRRKCCMRCQTVRLLTDFYLSATRSDGHDTQCKPCRREKGRVQRERARQKKRPQSPATKRCGRCEITKLSTEFSPCVTMKDGCMSWCKACCRENARQRRAKLLLREHVDMPDSKRCYACGLVRSADAFHVDKAQLDGLDSRCKTCRADQRRARKYGMSRAQYVGLLEAQDRRCAICRGEFQGRQEPVVDHDHKTSVIRGLLCMGCNKALGLVHDDPERLERAAEYLRGVLV